MNHSESRNIMWKLLYIQDMCCFNGRHMHKRRWGPGPASGMKDLLKNKSVWIILHSSRMRSWWVKLEEASLLESRCWGSGRRNFGQLVTVKFWRYLLLRCIPLLHKRFSPLPDGSITYTVEPRAALTDSSSIDIWRPLGDLYR